MLYCFGGTRLVDDQSVFCLAHAEQGKYPAVSDAMDHPEHYHTYQVDPEAGFEHLTLVHENTSVSSYPRGFRKHLGAPGEAILNGLQAGYLRCAYTAFRENKPATTPATAPAAPAPEPEEEDDGLFGD